MKKNGLKNMADLEDRIRQENLSILLRERSGGQRISDGISVADPDRGKPA